MQRPCRVYNMKTEALPLGRGGTERPDTLSSRLRRFPPTSFSATSYYIDKRGGSFALFRLVVRLWKFEARENKLRIKSPRQSALPRAFYSQVKQYIL